jgi:hypothetical protein
MYFFFISSCSQHKVKLVDHETPFSEQICERKIALLTFPSFDCENTEKCMKIIELNKKTKNPILIENQIWKREQLENSVQLESSTSEQVALKIFFGEKSVLLYYKIKNQKKKVKMKEIFLKWAFHTIKKVPFGAWWLSSVKHLKLSLADPISTGTLCATTLNVFCGCQNVNYWFISYYFLRSVLQLDWTELSRWRRCDPKVNTCQ